MTKRKIQTAAANRKRKRQKLANAGPKAIFSLESIADPQKRSGIACCPVIICPAVAFSDRGRCRAAGTL